METCGHLEVGQGKRFNDLKVKSNVNLWRSVGMWMGEGEGAEG